MTMHWWSRAHLGWMFEPEDSATEEQEKPSEAGFYAIILSKVIDEVSILQNIFLKILLFLSNHWPWTQLLMNRPLKWSTSLFWCFVCLRILQAPSPLELGLTETPLCEESKVCIFLELTRRDIFKVEILWLFLKVPIFPHFNVAATLLLYWTTWTEPSKLLLMFPWQRAVVAIEWDSSMVSAVGSNHFCQRQSSVAPLKTSTNFAFFIGTIQE